MARLLLWIAIGMGLAVLLTASWQTLLTLAAIGVALVAGWALLLLISTRGMSDSPRPWDHY